MQTLLTLIDQLSEPQLQNGTSSISTEPRYSPDSRTTIRESRAIQSSSLRTRRRRRLSYWRRSPLNYLELSGHYCLKETEVLVKLPGRSNPIGVVVDLENNRWG